MMIRDGKELSADDFKARGLENDSVVADPGFKDPEKRDFTLKEDSPAWEIGFQPIDVSDVGPRN